MSRFRPLDKAAKEFSVAFFRELNSSDAEEDGVEQYKRAFIAAKNQLKTAISGSSAASPSGASGHKYEFCDPFHPGDWAWCEAMGRMPVGIPEFLCEGQATAKKHRSFYD